MLLLRSPESDGPSDGTAPGLRDDLWASTKACLQLEHHNDVTPQALRPEN